MRYLLFAIIPMAIITASCSNNDILRSEPPKSLNFYLKVSEVVCDYYDEYDRVKANCIFETLNDTLLYSFRYDSPDVPLISLPFGEYRVYVESGRCSRYNQLYYFLEVSDSGLRTIFVDTVPYTYDQIVVNADTAWIRNFAVYGDPDTALFSFYYANPADSLGINKELEKIRYINWFSGDYFIIDSIMREIVTSEWSSSISVDYTSLLKPRFFMYEGINAAYTALYWNGYRDPSMLDISSKYVIICTD